MNGSGHTFLENKTREPRKTKSQSLDCPRAFHVVSSMLSTIMAKVRWDEPHSDCFDLYQLPVPGWQKSRVLVQKWHWVFCRHPCGTSMLFLWLVTMDLRDELQKKSGYWWHICGQKVQQNRAPKQASLVTASSAQSSPRHLLGPCLFLTTWLETCYGSEYFPFLNGRVGVTCKGFHPLANVKIWLKLDITQNTLSWLLVGTSLHVAKLK